MFLQILALRTEMGRENNEPSSNEHVEPILSIIAYKSYYVPITSNLAKFA